MTKKDDSKMNSPIDEENIYSFMINNDPIALEVEILAKNNKIYKYGFEVLKDKIISEWLFEKRVNKFYSIFEREDNNVSMKLHINNSKCNLHFLKCKNCTLSIENRFGN